MNILLVTVAYPPEIRSCSQLMQELAIGLTERKHHVTVVTCYPGYNLTKKDQQVVFPTLSEENGVEVLRVKTPPPHKVHFIIRGLAQLSLPYLFFLNIKKNIKHTIDAVIVYSPPLPLAIVGTLLKRFGQARFILNVQDIFPQNAIDLGILKNKLLIKLFEKLESSIYRSADYLAVHSEGNREFLIKQKKIKENKVKVIHNWIEMSGYQLTAKEGRFRKAYGLEDKFIFLFAGVTGPSQGLELIVELARRLKENKEVCFLLVGDGTEKEKLIALAETYKLTNVSFQPFIASREYPELLKEVDVGMVCLSAKNKTPVVPGKILGYMAAKIPVLAFLNRESDGHQIIKEARCGYSSFSDDIEQSFRITEQLYQERNNLAEYGGNGYHYAVAHFAREICLNKIEELLTVS